MTDWKCWISCLFPIDFSFLWDCDQHWYSCSLSACMLQCCFLFGMATSVGLCEDCVSPSLSSSPLPLSVYELYGRNTVEYFRKQGYDGFFFKVTNSSIYSMMPPWLNPFLLPPSNISSPPQHKHIICAHELSIDPFIFEFEPIVNFWLT